MCKNAILFCITLLFFTNLAFAKQGVKSDGSYSYGVYDDSSNKWIIPPKFTKIIGVYDSSEYFYACRFSNKFAIYNSDGTKMTRFAFDECSSFKYGPLFAVKQNGLWGVVTLNWTVIPFEYEEIQIFHSGYVNLKRSSNTRERLEKIDFLKVAKEALSVKKEYPYDSELEDKANWYINLPTTQDYKCGKKLTETSSTKHFRVSDISRLKLYDCRNGYFVVRETNTNRTFIFNDKGENTGTLSTLGCSSFDVNKVAFMTLTDKTMAIVKPDGTILKKFGEMYYLPQFVDGIAKISLNHKTYYIDSNGNPILSFIEDPSYYNVEYPIEDGMRLFKKNGKFGYLHNNQIAISAKYDEAQNFSEGLAAVAIKDVQQILWGFIDKQGNYVIQPKFSNEPSSFHNGFAVVKKKNEKQCLIDKTGQVVSQEHDYISEYYEGYFFGEVDYSKRLLVANSNREIICDTYCDRQRCYCSQGLLIDGHNIFSSKGEPLVCLGNSTTGKFNDAVTYCKSDSKVGYINTAGDWILIFDEDEF